MTFPFQIITVSHMQFISHVLVQTVIYLLEIWKNKGRILFQLGLWLTDYLLLPRSPVETKSACQSTCLLVDCHLTPFLQQLSTPPLGVDDKVVSASCSDCLDALGKFIMFSFSFYKMKGLCGLFFPCLFLCLLGFLPLDIPILDGH